MRVPVTLKVNGEHPPSAHEMPSMSVYIQFAPALAKPEPTLSDPGVGEDESVLRHAKVWEKECRAASRHTKQRPYRAVATDGMGRSVHLCRYIASAQLPPGFQGAIADEPTLRQLMRFCHLVPHVTDMSAFNLPPGVDIWTTSQEFLDMCAGDSEEHVDDALFAVCCENFADSREQNACLCEPMKYLV